MGNVSPPSDSEIEPEMNMGIILGAEFSMGSLKVGAGYFQGGYNVEQSETLEGLGEVSMSGSVTLNYINTYAIFPLYHQGRISTFGGLQGGFSLGGTAEFDAVFGIGFNYGGFTLDMELDPGFYTDPVSHITGHNGSSLGSGKATITYNW